EANGVPCAHASPTPHRVPRPIVSEAGRPQPVRMRRRLRGPFARWPRAPHTTPAVGVFGLSLFVVSKANNDIWLRSPRDPTVATVLVCAVASGALVWRRRWPLQVLAATLVATTVATPMHESDLVGLSIVIALYSVGRYVDHDRWSFTGLGATLVSIAVSGALDDRTTLGETAFGLVVMTAVWSIGRGGRLPAQ